MKAFPQDYIPTVFDNHEQISTYLTHKVGLGLWDTGFYYKLIFWKPFFCEADNFFDPSASG